MGHSTVEAWLAAGNEIKRGPDYFAVPTQQGQRAPNLTPEPVKPKNSSGSGFEKVHARTRARMAAYEKSLK